MFTCYVRSNNESLISSLFLFTKILLPPNDARCNVRIIDPWCVLYIGSGVLCMMHPFTLCIFIITEFTCVLIIISIIP
jgi:hypothetical protein